ncbi:MAG: hypothetical protein ACI3V4_10940 [Faecousia sp.]
MKLNTKEKGKVISCCNEKLISDYNFDSAQEYPAEWFRRQFSFIDNEKLREHLGDEFYQTRFTFTLMETLSLPMSKNKGIIKFQIIQYASICEAILNYTLEMFFKDEFENRYAATQFSNIEAALSSKTKITYEGKPVFICKPKMEKAKITWTSNPTKAEFAVEKGILTEETKGKYCALYDLRNNTHILKAATADYYPKPKEAKAAYELLFQFLGEVRAFYAANQRQDEA